MNTICTTAAVAGGIDRNEGRHAMQIEAITPRKAPPCRCSAYKFPHRDGAGKCLGEGWCDNCGAGTVFRGSGGACYSYQWQYCPECGWSNS